MSRGQNNIIIRDPLRNHFRGQGINYKRDTLGASSEEKMQRKEYQDYGQPTNTKFDRILPRKTYEEETVGYKNYEHRNCICHQKQKQAKQFKETKPQDYDERYNGGRQHYSRASQEVHKEYYWDLENNRDQVREHNPNNYINAYERERFDERLQYQQQQQQQRKEQHQRRRAEEQQQKQLILTREDLNERQNEYIQNDREKIEKKPYQDHLPTQCQRYVRVECKELYRNTDTWSKRKSPRQNTTTLRSECRYTNKNDVEDNNIGDTADRLTHLRQHHTPNEEKNQCNLEMPESFNEELYVDVENYNYNNAHVTNYVNESRQYIEKNDRDLKETEKANSLKQPPPQYGPLTTYRQHTENKAQLLDSDNESLDNGVSLLTVKSQRSDRTVVSRKSAHELREVVRSQIALQNEVEDSITTLRNQGDNKKESSDKTQNQTQMQTKTPEIQNLNDFSVYPSNDRSLEKRLTADEPEMLKNEEKCDAAVAAATTTTTNTSAERSVTSVILDTSISIDDIINTKVISPMVRKVQRMYLNTLQEEMTLLQDLERMPTLVSEVYRANVDKQQQQQQQQHPN